MRELAIECATEACSIALSEDGQLIGHSHEILGRGHAERLVPAISDLPGRGRAHKIRVSLGPGSFTGVRIGLAVARALGLAWQADVTGYPTLALVAAMAQSGYPGQPVTVCMTGGHGEWFVQNFDGDGLPEGPVRSRTPESAIAENCHPFIAGSRSREMLALIGDGAASFDCLPDARHAFTISPTLSTSDLSPIYGRAPDARLPGVGT